MLLSAGLMLPAGGVTATGLILTLVTNSPLALPLIIGGLVALLLGGIAGAWPAARARGAPRPRWLLAARLATAAMAPAAGASAAGLILLALGSPVTMPVLLIGLAALSVTGSLALACRRLATR